MCYLNVVGMSVSMKLRFDIVVESVSGGNGVVRCWLSRMKIVL